MRRALIATLALCAACAPVENPAGAALSAVPAAIDLPGDNLHPESVAIGPGGVAYVSGMNGAVLRVKLATGAVEQWIAPGTFGAGALFGVLADTRNQMLWTCTNDFSARGVSVAGADAGSWLKGFDLKTGAGRISLKLPGEGAICNDMAVGANGTVYIADTKHPRILRWQQGSTALEIWAEDTVFGADGGLDGLAFGSDGDLYINNVRTGALFRVALEQGGKAGTITPLKTSRPLLSPDGMRPVSGMQFALAEGGGIISLLDVTGDTVEVTTLAEGINQPTAVDVADGTVWYVQGQLTALFNPAAPRPALPFKLVPVSAKPARE